MPVHTLNPLEDVRWDELCQRHPDASVFHTTAWLQALRQTYGYEPVVYTTSCPGAALRNGMVFCLVRSWLTGRRMISVPFADHCDPLIGNNEELREILECLHSQLRKQKLKYIEIRPLRAGLATESCLGRSDVFCHHSLDLGPDSATLFQGFHKNSIQRKIRRAEREGLGYESGNSESLLNRFYPLLVMTRRRHNLPPQPIEWFRNLMAVMPDRLAIRVAYYRDFPVASILTLRHGQTLVYKYGCSDARHHNLGGMPFLFWRTVQDAKSAHLQSFDFGRSDVNNPGLIRFKDRWGTTRSVLEYARMSVTSSSERRVGHVGHFAQRLFGCMPDRLSMIAGRLLYRHMA